MKKSVTRKVTKRQRDPQAKQNPPVKNLIRTSKPAKDPSEKKSKKRETTASEKKSSSKKKTSTKRDSLPEQNKQEPKKQTKQRPLTGKKIKEKAVKTAKTASRPSKTTKKVKQGTLPNVSEKKRETRKREGKKIKRVALPEKTIKTTAKSAEKKEKERKRKPAKKIQTTKETLKKVSGGTKPKKAVRTKKVKKGPLGKNRQPESPAARKVAKTEKTAKKITTKTVTQPVGKRATGKKRKRLVKSEKEQSAQKTVKKDKKTRTQKTREKPDQPEKKIKMKKQEIVPVLESLSPLVTKEPGMMIVDQSRRKKSPTREIVQDSMVKRPKTKGRVAVRASVEQDTEKERAGRLKKERAFSAYIKGYQADSDEKLASGYMENRIVLMEVDPHTIFTYWEVREDALQIFEGSLTLRVYDITGVDYDHPRALSYTDINVKDRVGSAYLTVSHSREFIAEIGILYKNVFINLARSNKAATPVSLTAADRVYDDEPESDQLIGYEN